MNTKLRTEAKNDFEKDFFKPHWIIQSLEKLWAILESTEFFNL